MNTQRIISLVQAEVMKAWGRSTSDLEGLESIRNVAFRMLDDSESEEASNAWLECLALVNAKLISLACEPKQEIFE